MIKFPSIEQYRHVIENVKFKAQYIGRDENNYPLYDDTIPLPTLNFCGTVKLHGTNSSVVYNTNGTLQAQSRNREINLTKDNMGFAKFVHEDVGKETFLNLFHIIFKKELAQFSYVQGCAPKVPNPFTIYGEWCGPGIMSGTGINQLNKKIFVIFGIRVGKGDDSYWVNLKPFANTLHNHDKFIYNIFEFPHYQIDINFNDTKTAYNKMLELTSKVEEQCPVALSLGAKGIGEGIVWTCEHKDFTDSKFRFKIKGKKHRVSTTKMAKELSPEELKLQSSIEGFIEATVTDNRLKQGVEALREMGLEITVKNMGSFIKWVSNDILKEEYDIMQASGISQKNLNKPLSNKARVWFQDYLNKEAGIA